jgi:peptide/nickel transport system permease protein
MTKNNYISIILLIIFISVSLFGEFGYQLKLYKYSPYTGNKNYSDQPPSSYWIKKILFNEVKYDKNYPPIRSLNNQTDEYHGLGTDDQGRDILILLCKSASVYFICGTETVIVAIILGLILGSMAGYRKFNSNNVFEKFLNNSGDIIRNIIDVFPLIVIIIIAVIWTQKNLYLTMLFFGVVYSSKIASIVKNKIEVLNKSGFIEAANELGLSNLNILLKQIIWYNCRFLLIVQIIYCFIGVILIESTLSYLGLSGLKWITWGSIIFSGIGGQPAVKLYSYGMYWQSIPAILLIIISIGCLHFIANSIKTRQ